MKQISGAEAIERMREIRHDPKKYFTLHHLTFNSRYGTSKGMRVVERCRLRPALPKEYGKRPSDLYLPYYDIIEEKNGVAFRKLIRFVAFSPDFELLKVNWFNAYED